MHTRFYDDAIDTAPLERSLFLAGPTVRGHGRTPWRATALNWLAARGFDGTVVIPEFADAPFEVRAPQRFVGPSQTPGLSPIAHGVLAWETCGIERVTVVLFWMPFVVRQADDPTSLPGFTTRAEVSRELSRDPRRLVLGMPSTANSSGHIRYHAQRAGVPIWPTLETTLEHTLAKLDTTP